MRGGRPPQGHRHCAARLRSIRLIHAFRRVVSTLMFHQLTRAASVLLGVSLLAFASLNLAPGDPLAELRLDPQITPAAVAALRDRYGLNRPLVERYTRWLGSV